MRFGFADFIDDAEVVDALFSAAQEWGPQARLHPPLSVPMGFSDLDHEGMLIEGFEECKAQCNTIHNPLNYPAHRPVWAAEGCGLGGIPHKDSRQHTRRNIQRTSRYSGTASTTRVSKKYIAQENQRGNMVWLCLNWINEAYADLYGYSPLTRKGRLATINSASIWNDAQGFTYAWW